MKRVAVLMTALLVACTQTTPSVPASPAATSTPVARSSLSHITRIQIDKVESPTFEGKSFGNVGPYEKLVGRAFGEIDPKDAQDSVITDLEFAPRNARGMVEYSTDIFILKPVDLLKGNHRLLHHVNNRGNLGFLGSLNDGGGANTPSKAADAGNGYLMRQGYTIASVGWDVTVQSGDGRLTITVPVAKNTDGSSIVGPALEEFVIDSSTTMTGNLTYPAASLDKSKATLTVRTLTTDAPTTIAASGWEYVDTSTVRLLPAGTPFQNGHLYELAYQAKDPLVAGIGFAALRDVTAFLRRATIDDAGNRNPLAGDVQNVYTHCISQPCRTMHEFLYLGFNQDQKGKIVVDGIMNWIGGASGIFMNYRFAQPGRTHRQHIARRYPEFEFPFGNTVITDPVTKKTDGWLRSCLATNTCPKIFEINSENEYWAKAGSNLTTDANGNDVAEAPNVRTYLMSSLPHGAGTGPGICQQPRNPLNSNPVLRAMLVNLDDWVTKSTTPPASRYPRRADGTLVAPLPQAEMGFPAIPGVTYNGVLHSGDLFDFGPNFAKGVLTVVPPTLLATPYKALVPKTDVDGNDIAGIRLADISAPVATYTGWGLRAGPAAQDGCDASGQKIDFKKTKAERLASGDPRLSLEERYGTQQSYVDKVTAAANGLVVDRFFLQEDVAGYIAAAQALQTGLPAK